MRLVTYSTRTFFWHCYMCSGVRLAWSGIHYDSGILPGIYAVIFQALKVASFCSLPGILSSIYFGILPGVCSGIQCSPSPGRREQTQYSEGYQATTGEAACPNMGNEFFPK